jgi:branched-chain amino acid transport system substrate-binding protein
LKLRQLLKKQQPSENTAEEKRIMMKHRLICWVCLVAVLLVSCAPGAGVQNAPIKIAILAPLSGPAPTYGVSHRNAAQLAIDEWNAKGGVLGHKIESVVVDSQCAPDPAVNAANKVIDQDKAHYIIGEVCSKASVPVAELAESKGVLMITPSSTAEAITIKADGSAKSMVFRTCFINPFQGKVMAKFAQTKGYKTAFIMVDIGNDYVRGLAEAFEKAWTAAGNQVVGKENYSSSDTDFSAILTKVSESKPDVLWLPDYYNVVNLVASQAKDKGVTAVIMGGDAWDSADLDLKVTNGDYFSNFYSADDPRPVVQDWVKKYKDKFSQSPDSIATMAYDATNLLLAGIAKAGVDDPKAVAKTLETIEFDGVTGKIKFDDKHNPVKPAAILQVKDGKITFIDMVTP